MLSLSSPIQTAEYTAAIREAFRPIKWQKCWRSWSFSVGKAIWLFPTTFRTLHGNFAAPQSRRSVGFACHSRHNVIARRADDEAIGKMLTTRPAEEADLPRLVQLLWDDEQGRTRESLSSDDYGDYLAAFRSLKADANAALLVVVDNGEVCGCLQLNLLSGLSFRGMRRALIEDVRVARSHRRNGIGKHIVCEAVQYARSNGCGMIELFVHDDRKAAHAFYEACGFVGEHRGYRQRFVNG